MAASSSSRPAASDFDGSKASAAMDKYSRQVGAYGVGVMKFLREFTVLIVGMKGVGIETAKDLILTGAKSVLVADDNPAEIADLGTNFFLTAESVGQPRGPAVVAALQELNDDVEVSAVSGEINTDLFTRVLVSEDDPKKTCAAVIVTDNTIPLAKLAEWDNFCAAHNIAFALAITSGPFGFLFSDFGDLHQVTDADGEPHIFVVIKDLVVDGENLLVDLDDAHNLEDGQQVQFEDVQGIPQLEPTLDAHGNKVYRSFKVQRVYNELSSGRKCLVPDKLVVHVGPELASWGRYEKGGAIREVKPVVEMQHKRLEAALLDTQVRHPHQMRAMLQSAGQQGVIVQRALWGFIAAHGHLPRLHSTEDAEAFVKLAEEINSSAKAANAPSVEELDRETFTKAALYARTEMTGFAAFMGGVIAQEVIKKCGKWTPLNQILVHDEFGMVSATVPADAAPIGSRYDHQIALFGLAFHNSIINDHWFLVGCGALGCEYLKAFALMGVGCGPDGLLHATDMDTIEVSNLARQFLFRKEHVHKPKSLCAAAAARKMNPDMKIKDYLDKVAPDTEGIFDHAFWTSLTGVCNALDNIQARLYVDSRITFYKRPLLESGTLGTKANVDIIIPFKTGNYKQGHVDVQEKHVPQCTMKNFPYQIEHCIGWAGKAGEFNNLFVTPATDLKNAVQDLDSLWKSVGRLKNISEKIERLENLTELLETAKGATFKTCVELAFKRLIQKFRTDIKDLIHQCPETLTVTKKDGKELPAPIPFWSAPKRFPKAIEWDPSDPAPHLLEFLYNAANLYAHMFSLPHIRDRDAFAQFVKDLNLAQPEWAPSSKKISDLADTEPAPVDPAAPSSSAGSAAPVADSPEEDEAKLEKLKSTIASFDFGELKERNAAIQAEDPKACVIQPAEFEKDDDTNFHIDFVTACSNLRAFNYSIPPADRHRTKMIAGNIIPAIATTTAMITGLNSIEFLKLKQNPDVDKFCSANINLGTSSYELFEPDGPKRAQKEYDVIEMCDLVPVPDGFTIWDSVQIQRGDLTVKELVEVFPSVHHGCVPIGINFAVKLENPNGGILYTDLASGDLKAQVDSLQDRKISEIWKEVVGPLPACGYLLVDIVCTKDDVPVKIPNPCSLFFNKLQGTDS